MIPALSSTNALTSKSFVAVWLLSSLVTTFLAGRWKYCALALAGISGGYATSYQFGSSLTSNAGLYLRLLSRLSSTLRCSPESSSYPYACPFSPSSACYPSQNSSMLLCDLQPLQWAPLGLFSPLPFLLAFRPGKMSGRDSGLALASNGVPPRRRDSVQVSAYSCSLACLSTSSCASNSANVLTR